MTAALRLDDIDRRIVNGLQGGFPIADRPYAEAAKALDLTEDELIARLQRLRDAKALSRFGPFYNAERMGGALTLAALAAPDARFEEVAGLVNAHPEVAHNYARDHRLNMWFVLATETPAEIERALAEIERETGLKVFDFPKQAEYFIGLKVEV